MGRVEWQFFGGIRSIGGTIIVLTYDNHRLIFDMGRNYNPAVPVFDSQIKARDIKDIQRLGQAPRIDGLFRDDGTHPPNGTFTMAAVSHSHLDHVGLLPFLRFDVPVLLSEDTHTLLKALDKVADGPGQPLSYLPSPAFEYTEFGPFRIQVVPVDHDTPGASAFFIEVDDMRFVYSGDVRLHGSNPKLTLDMAKRAREFGADVLWIEGTRSSAADNTGITSEPDLPNVLIEKVSSSQAGAYFTIYPRHPERVAAFQTTAQATGRQLVLDAPTAYIYEAFGGSLNGISVYGGNKDSWTFDVQQWMRLRKLSIVKPADLRGNEQQFLVEMPYSRLIDWVDIDAKPGGIFLHSNGTPLGPYDPAWNNLMQWLHVFGLTFVSAGSTGHGSRGDILSLIDTVRPRVLMPIHSMQPELIGLPHVKRIMPEYGKVYTPADLDAATFPTDAELAPPTQE